MMEWFSREMHITAHGMVENREAYSVSGFSKLCYQIELRTHFSKNHHEKMNGPYGYLILG